MGAAESRSRFQAAVEQLANDKPPQVIITSILIFAMVITIIMITIIIMIMSIIILILSLLITPTSSTLRLASSLCGTSLVRRVSPQCR